MQILTGKETTILAMLAQKPKLPAKDKERILNNLAGTALNIARAIIGELPSTKPSQYFVDWAKNLKEK